MTNRLTLFAVLSAAVAFGQGAGMKQLKSVTGAEYVCTTNAVTVTQTAVTNEAALRRIGDLAGSNYVDAVAAGIEAGSVSHADVAGTATNAVYAGLAGVASNALTAGNANYASVANTASNAILVTGAQSNLIASAWQNRTDVQAGNWTYTSDGISITITGYTGSETSLTLPEFIDGLPVSAIAANAFEGALFSTFNIPFAVSIGAEAFKNCLSLSSINVKNVTSLGEYAFAGCTSLESFEASNLRVVPNYAFIGCYSLNAIILPSAVTIGDSAFNGCALTSIDIPKVTNIGQYAFQSCFFSGLVLPTISDIGAGAFTDCVNLQKIFYGANAPSDGGNIFSGIPPDQFTNVVLNTTATGWGTTYSDRPVSRMTAKSDYADVRYSIEMFGYTWTWNTEFHTFDVELDGGVTGQLFQEQHVYAKNMTGAPLLEGRAVCVRGAVGDNVLVGYADASDHTCQWTTIGLVTQTGGIANDGFGYVCTFGNVNDINTSAFQVSNTLWLASNGTITNVEPVITATGSKIKIGTVLRAHATQGRVFVNVAVVPNWTDVGAVDAVAVTNIVLANQQFSSTLYGWRSVPSDVAGAFTLSNGLPTTPPATVTNLSTTNGAYVARFVTGQPRFTRISQGAVNVHMHHRKGPAGAATLRPELYILDSLGNKLWEYDAAQVSDPLTTALADSTIPIPIPSNIVLQASWRIGIYIKAFVTVGSPDIYIDLEDNANLIVTVPTPSVEYVTQSQLTAYPTFPQVSNIVQEAAGGVTVASHGVVLGDSTIAAYAGGTEVASLLVTAGDRLAGNSVVSLAVPGHTIAQQYAAWTNYAGRATSVWVAVQVGLNDLLPAANVTNVVADYQALVNRIRTDAPTAKILVATMTPTKQRYIDVYGGTGGAASYAWWQFLNVAVMGGGTHPVTNVDMRVSSHTDVLNDGAGNLASVYDTGDHVHENTAARTVIAAEWRRALNVYGLLPASASSWYRDTIVSEQVNALDTRLSTEKLDVEDGTAYRLVSRQGMTFYENSVRLFPAWTNGVPVLAVSISGTNYVFNLQTPVNFSETAPAWYDALALDSVWPVDEGAGTNLLDASVVRNAWLSGTTAWETYNGADCVYLDGTSGKGSIGDFYDVGTNSFMLGAWFCLTNLPATASAGLVSKAAGYGYEVSFFLSSSGILVSQFRNGAGASLLNMVGSVPVSTGIWHHAALVVNRSAGAAIVLDGQTYLSATNTLSGVDFQSAEPMVFGSRNLANTYLKGFLGSVQIDMTADTNTAVGVWNASRATYGR